MAVDPVPYVVHGAKHSADVFRQAYHDLSAGAEGVSLPQSLHVKQTGTPSNQVQVMPGGVVLPNTYSGGGGQSYTGRVASATLVDVPASDSTGAKSYHIIFRVEDPQFGGQSPSNPLVGPYSFLECVPTSANVPHPHYRLAKIDVPASTATITNAMITDLRDVAMPRTLDVWRPRASVREDTEELTAYQDGDGEWFPNAGGEQRVFVPEWATRVQIAATWMGVRIASGKNGWGEYWVEFGPYVRQSVRKYSTQRYQWDTVGTTATTYRESWLMEDDRAVPADIRGTEQPFIMKALRFPESDNAAAMIDFKSGVSLKLRFLQVAEPSTS